MHKGTRQLRVKCKITIGTQFFLDNCRHSNGGGFLSSRLHFFVQVGTSQMSGQPRLRPVTSPACSVSPWWHYWLGQAVCPRDGAQRPPHQQLCAVGRGVPRAILTICSPPPPLKVRAPQKEGQGYFGGGLWLKPQTGGVYSRASIFCIFFENMIFAA